MDRRVFVTTALGWSVAGKVLAAPPATLGIRQLLVSSTTVGPDRGSRIRGTMTFRVTRSAGVLGPTLSLVSYWGRECPELIQRYAQSLSFNGFTGRRLTALGDGKDCAANFASRSGGLFTAVRSRHADLPKPGAVLSVAAWSNSYPGKHGHVGIVQRVGTINTSSTTATVTIFDQNFPGSSWKTLEFTRPAYDRRRPNATRNWTGEFVNRGSSATSRASVSWTDPTG